MLTFHHRVSVRRSSQKLINPELEGRQDRGEYPLTALDARRLVTARGESIGRSGTILRSIEAACYPRLIPPRSDLKYELRRILASRF